MKINKYSIILQYLDACKKSMDLAKLYDAEKTEKILIKLQASEKKVEKIEKELERQRVTKDDVNGILEIFVDVAGRRAREGFLKKRS